ncbi:hypothetical protein BKA93DRAFT_236116 [Sparassis latifolia]|uniref:Arrestin C-terminal-like domain-containing protein n=1 Tax=Sparassis crispa TaxID=139825 RepID=A0A401GEX0_9APHY|nr:hypothetical protein SCP_0304630 [Sparassis crispa]GBE80744.1 hypothetical protein SCP_0304630 [Sparassis crispa]
MLMPSSAKLPHKNTLEIRLAENVVFLRAGDATGRLRSIQADAPPGMLRGLLTLTLVKPTRISSIEIELMGKTSTAWPEGIGARRIDISEEHDIYSESYVLFRAGSSPFSSRRTLSVGPGLALDHEDEDHSDHSSEQLDAARTPEEQRGRDRGPPSAGFNRATRRHLSVDQTTFQRGFVSHRENSGQLPPSPQSPAYSPEATPQYSLSPRNSISYRMHTLEESPPRSPDSSRMTYGDSDADHRSTFSGRSQSLVPESTTFSFPQDGLYSGRPSLDEDREFQVGNSTGTLQPRSLSRLAPRREPSRSSEGTEMGSGEDARGRKHKRFSFANVSSVLLDAVRDHVRSRSPMIEQFREATPPRGRAVERTLERPDGAPAGPMQARLRGYDGESAEEIGDGWKEFRKGVYTYPISFAIPAMSPPTLNCDYGTVSWNLKAYAHRPGTFTSKLSATQEITVVACPGEDDTEESESIIVERQWETQMQYLISISGRCFAIGGVMPVTITFMPWTKMKIHRISVLIEEKIDYWTNFKRVVRSDPLARVSLLSYKSPQKDGPPILPLNPDDPDAFRNSPFVDVVGADTDVGEFASSLMGPGPWTLHKDISLLKEHTPLHFTNKNRRSNMSVSHTLKIVFRVERGDNEALDPHTGKRKLFDIVVQTPIHILSYLCNPEHLSLPPYSRVMEPTPGTTLHWTSLPGSATQLNGDRSRYTSLLSPGPVTHADLGFSAHSSTTTSEQSLSMSMSPSHTGAAFEPDSIYDRSTQFERLVAGQESEIGEAPPSYEAVVHA